MKVFNDLRKRYLTMAGLAVVVVVATAIPRSEAVPPRKDAPQRYAHRFFPPGVGWIPESEIPADPSALFASAAHSHHLLPDDPEKPLTEDIWEVSLYPPSRKPTSKERDVAKKLIERSYESATRKKWFDFDKGMADGFVLSSQSHYVNEKYVFDDAILDPERPEFLMYYDMPEGKKFTGFMFLVNEPLAQGPQIGGPLTLWHYHIFSGDLCFDRGLIIVAKPENGKCPLGAPQRRSPEMLHVWLIDHPDGQFSSQMIFPPGALKLALDRRFRERGY